MYYSDRGTACTYTYTGNCTDTFTYQDSDTGSTLHVCGCGITRYSWSSIIFDEEFPVNLYYCNGRTFTDYDSYINHKIMMERIRHPKNYKFQNNFKYSKKQNKKRHLQLKGNWVK